MSQSVPPIEAPPPFKSVMEPDPVLGGYIAHHPSNRFMLLVLGGIAYAIPVLLLQILFARADRTTAAIVLISAYSLVALVIGWTVLHLWNREVILYERGFTYREGSHVRPFLYVNILSFQQKAVRFSIFQRWPLVVYRCTLHTDQDEILNINNIYSQIELLVRRLEAAITRARLPVVAARLQSGESVSFGPISLSGQAIHVGDKTLPWHLWGGYRFANNQLILVERSGETWTALPVLEIDQILLLVALLKATVEQRQATAEPRQSADVSRNGAH